LIERLSVIGAKLSHCVPAPKAIFLMVRCKPEKEIIFLIIINIPEKL